jgi:hypothetical protein
VDNSAIFRWGGEGVVAARQSYGSIRPSEKVKMKKSQPTTIPLRKKKTIDQVFAIVHPYHAHNDKDNREDRTDGQHPR